MYKNLLLEVDSIIGSLLNSRPEGTKNALQPPLEILGTPKKALQPP
jgi:hypothetical protein